MRSYGPRKRCSCPRCGKDVALIGDTKETRVHKCPHGALCMAPLRGFHNDSCKDCKALKEK